MKVNGKNYQTIWIDPQNDRLVQAIDQRLLPHKFEVVELKSLSDVYTAISDMTVRGAPLIGAAAAYGMYLAGLEALNASDFDQHLYGAAIRLAQSRPTAINLQWAIDAQLATVAKIVHSEAKVARLKTNAIAIANAESNICFSIGQNGLNVIRRLSQNKTGKCVNILTHCNAGWLCSIDWGTATAPIYQAFNEDIDIHVWVDETRPRNQGASLTAWELGQHGVPYTLITDNAGGHLMQQGRVDMVIVGTDRLTRNGDAANKIGTYLKALAANDNAVPFYVAAPSTSIDWKLSSGKQIPIEERHADEVKYISGLSDDAQLIRVLICPEDAQVANFGFDVTPARLITGIITERGIAEANETALLAMFPEMKPASIP
jgi:methylthioribose-1-phosphate isomerase